jgi:hypothetical protein
MLSGQCFVFLFRRLTEQRTQSTASLAVTPYPLKELMTLLFLSALLMPLLPFCLSGSCESQNRKKNGMLNVTSYIFKSCLGPFTFLP